MLAASHGAVSRGGVMVLQSLVGLPAFLVYFGVSALVVLGYLFIYTRITAHNEFALMRNGVASAAVSLGLSLVGFALPVASAIFNAASIVDCIVWSIVAFIVQIVVYYVARIPVPDLSKRIEAGEIGPAIWLGLASVTAGLLSAASMTSPD
jgi:putative membrane protein